MSILISEVDTSRIQSSTLKPAPAERSCVNCQRKLKRSHEQVADEMVYQQIPIFLEIPFCFPYTRANEVPSNKAMGDRSWIRAHTRHRPREYVICPFKTTVVWSSSSLSRNTSG